MNFRDRDGAEYHPYHDLIKSHCLCLKYRFKPILLSHNR